MTDHDTHGCGETHPRICPHTAGPDAPCCNLDCFPCPQHFTELGSEAMMLLSAGAKYPGAEVMAHIVAHGWLVPAALTWSALLYRYGPLPGQSRDEAVARVDTSSPQGVPSDQVDAHRAWMFRLGAIVRSAMLGDGDTILDTLKSVQGDPEMTSPAFMSLVTSIALAAHDAVAQHQVDPRAIAAFHVLGSQAMNAPGFTMMETLVQMAERPGAPDDEHDLSAEVVDRLNAATPNQLLSAMGIAGRALAQMIEVKTGGPVLISSTDDLMLVDWRDTSLDAARTEADMAPVLALRVASAFSRYDIDGVTQMVQGADDSARFCVDVIVGCCTMIGTEIAGMAARAEP